MHSGLAKHDIRRKNAPLTSLKKQREFKFVHKNGKSAAMPLFVVLAAKNELGVSRLGISASKKVGNAIVRNRIRRLAKEVCRLMFRENLTGNSCGFDIVIIARVPAGELPRTGSFAAVHKTLSKLFKRLGVHP